MNNNYFLSWGAIALFSLLTACGGSSSKSSGGMNIASCNIGNNPIAEGQSCMVEANSTVYSCKSNMIVASTPQLKPRSKVKTDAKDVVTGIGSARKIRNQVVSVSTDSNKPRDQRSSSAKAIIFCASNPPN